MIGVFEGLDGTGDRYSCESRSEFALIIMNEIPGCSSIRRGFAQLLRHPSIGGRRRDGHMDDCARLQLDNEAGKQRAEEEVADL